MAVDVAGFAPLIQVFDMPTSLRFYREVMGFTVVAQSSPGDECDWCMLRRDRMILMLNTAYERDHRPATMDPARIDSHGDTALFFECPDPDAAYSALLEMGVTARKPRVTGYGMKQVYLLDPDGYTLCLQCEAV